MQELEYIQELGEEAVARFNEKIINKLNPKQAALEVLDEEYEQVRNEFNDFNSKIK